MRIVVDVDDVVNNMSDVLLPILNYRYHTNYIKSDITYWTWYGLHFSNPWKPLDEQHFWDVVEINPVAVQVLQDLVKDGHDVKLVTASMFHTMLPYKIERTLAAFDSSIINERNVIVAQDKMAVKADVRIDDNPHNLCTSDHAILFAQPWNSPNDACDIRTNNWYIIEHYLRSIHC